MTVVNKNDDTMTKPLLKGQGAVNHLQLAK